MLLLFHGLTDIGRKRPQNEDAWYADPELGLFLVSDGMGGEAAGALAARATAEILPELLRRRVPRDAGMDEPAVAHHVHLALAEISSEFRLRTEGIPSLEGMGATVVLAWLRRNKALIAHLGDSRAYHLRGDTLRQITQDHTTVRLLLEQGAITPEEAKIHPGRFQLTRAVGMEGRPLPDIVCVELEAGDRLLLCSDGLSGGVPTTTLEETLTQGPTPEAICRRLVDLANQAGGRDNITAVVVEVAKELEA